MEEVVSKPTNLDTLSDEHLIQKVQAGDHSRMGLLYERYHKDLYAYFYRCTSDTLKSEDLVHNVFFKILKNCHQYSGKSKFVYWLFTIVRNTQINDNKNTVYIKGSHNRQSNLVIQVPQNFSLKLRSHHNGNIQVSNVIGELEITSHHGWIKMDQIGGAVIADTHHGEITASFVSVTPNEPMAFSTYHGDVDITFPSSVNCVTKIKTAKGDIFTDFDLALKSVTENQTSNSGRRKIKIGGWMNGKLGSGGEEFLFNTHHGDVVIRKL